MIAEVKSETQTDAKRHDKFLGMLPAITRCARIRLSDRRDEMRDELVQEVIANCYVAYHRLAERGKAELAYPTVLVNFAYRQMFAGRKVGSPHNARDVMSRQAQRAGGVTVERLDRFDVHDGEWREALVEDRKAGPADTAAARIDFGSWLGSLPIRDRQIAEVLATGEKTGAVARKFGLTAARISQLRHGFATSWQQLQGDREPQYAEAS